MGLQDLKFYPQWDTWCIGSMVRYNGKVYRFDLTKFTYGSFVDHPIEKPQWYRFAFFERPDYCTDAKFHYSYNEMVSCFGKDKNDIYRQRFLKSIEQLLKLIEETENETAIL